MYWFSKNIEKQGPQVLEQVAERGAAGPKLHICKWLGYISKHNTILAIKLHENDPETKALCSKAGASVGTLPGKPQGCSAWMEPAFILS